MNTTDQGQQWIFGKSEIILKHDSVCLLLLKGKSQKDIRDANSEEKKFMVGHQKLPNAKKMPLPTRFLSTKAQY